MTSPSSSVAEVAHRWSVDPALLHRWVRGFIEGGTAQVTVFTPAQGGGTSGAINFAVSTPPVLAISAASVPAGSAITVTLTNGLGGASDWIAFAQTAAANNSV